MSEVLSVGGDAGEAALAGLLLQLTVIVLAARAGGAVALLLGQARVVGEIMVGVLLGPSLLGAAAPGVFDAVFPPASSATLYLLSQVGLVLLMFQVGQEFDYGSLRRRENRVAVLNVAGASLLLPFLLGFGFGVVTAERLSPEAMPLAVGLFIGTAFAITALPILGRIMLEFGMTRSALGVIAISAAAINDVVGWLLLAGTAALVTAQFNGSRFVGQIALLLVIVMLAWFVLRPLLKHALRCGIADDGRVSDSLLAVLMAGVFLFAMASSGLGIFAIFGGFFLGMLLHDERAIAQAWTTRMSPFVNVFFLPVFFTYTGLRTDIGSLDGWEAWGWCVLIVLLATAGKFGGAYFGARFSGLSRHQSRVLGVMMNTRALMELVVLNVGYELGVISQPVFTMLVIMALVSTLVTTPLLRRWLPEAMGAEVAPSAGSSPAPAGQQR